MLWTREHRAFWRGNGRSIVATQRAFRARLTPCDFFLWGYLKSIVYNDRPETLAHLKTNIRNAIAEIPVDMLQRVTQNFRNRLNQCIDNGGRHLIDVIFKSA
ncbi:PREDICTED: uncharacterized protein LOC108746509 isoform X2 [Trachymyrmex septentrionalis]|uniref:uncharacterized protein LOC108746509 isoform X1 n=1 Tax=Trachymyrmex septentrionalis TaxID=34720 RepID=UPI00084EDCC8|nr:PREDICTED: uncharacterized protein LOC108746509 isoform X1 [Trachymyrmex septentrionalis]XP_018338828.1 PREDICTED: uncharacterized protein LOC108746509 isoform X2 [Trachymyrmex septentrionalis]